MGMRSLLVDAKHLIVLSQKAAPFLVVDAIN
jgi:hypothetical protein